MKKTFITYLLCSSILPTTLVAQKISNKVEITTSKKYGKGNSITNVYSDNQSKLYTITWGSESSKINFLNEQLDIEKSVEAYVGDNFRGLLTVNKELYLFRMSKNKEDVNKLVYAKISANSTSVTDYVLLEKKEDKGKIVQSNYEVIASPNGKLFAVYYKYILKDATQSVHEVTVYDSLFNKVYSQSYTNLFKDEKITDKEKYLTNKGEFIWKYYNDNGHYIALIRKDKSTPVQLAISLPNKRMPDYSICLSDDGGCVISGPYFDAQGNTPVGVYSMLLDLDNGTLSEPKTAKFNFTLPEGPSAGAGSGLKNKTFGYLPLAPVYHDDNTVSVLFEQSFYFSTTTSRGTDVVIYFKYDVIVARVDMKTGAISFTTSIKKIQEVEAEEFGSVICSQKNNKLYVVYNDHIENINKYEPANLKEMKSGTVGFKESGIVMEEIDAAGNVTRELFYRDEENKDATIMPKLSVKTKNDNLYLFLKHEQSAALRQDWSKNFTYLTVKIK